MKQLLECVSLLECGVAVNQAVIVSSSCYTLYVHEPHPLPVIVCPDLPVAAVDSDPVITYDIGSMNSRPVNTTATYTCTSGYMLMGATTTRTCGSNMMWSGDAPTCEGECFVCVSTITDSLSSQLSTVEFSLTKPMEQWTHPLEPPL